jgi:hypothetical protein
MKMSPGRGGKVKAIAQRSSSLSCMSIEGLNRLLSCRAGDEIIFQEIFQEGSKKAAFAALSA